MTTAVPRLVGLVLLACFVTVTATLWGATAASAATVTTTVNGMTFSADDTSVPPVATLTGYTPGPVNVVIPSTVVIGATTYTVTVVGDHAFTNKNLSSMVIPDTVTTIEAWAFDSATLTSITIGYGVTTIGIQAFSNNNNLPSIVIPPSVTSIGFAAFAADGFHSVTVGSGVTTIGSYAFGYNPLASVTIPDGVLTIADHAFFSNTPLSSVTFLGHAPTSVGALAFNNTSPLVSYFWRFGSPQSAGGFTGPAWNGYPTQAIATRSFDSNGHGTAPAPANAVVGQALAAPADPTASGYSFAGWYVAASGGSPLDLATLAITGDQTLFAQWTTAAAAGPALAATGATAQPALVAALALLALGIAFRFVRPRPARRAKPR